MQTRMIMKKLPSTHRRAIRILLGCTVAIVVGVTYPLLNRGTFQAPDANASQPSASENQPLTGELTKGTPQYDTILPGGTSISKYGGWTRVSPPNRNPVFAYSDAIGKVPIIVSQQPLPQELAAQPSQQVGLLAKGYHAEKKIKVGSTEVYIGTSAKGPQSVIFTKNNLLVLIKASAGISEEQWRQYVGSLR